MSRELTIAFMGFAIAAFYTPGPNNIMLLSSGLNYGFRRTVPHIAGITLGFAFLVLIVGLGMGAVFCQLSAAADGAEICRRRLPALSCDRNRAGEAHRPREGVIAAGR